MQVVILAAGKSSRFSPYSKFSHKTLIPVLGKPILEHTLLSVKKAGITEVIIVVSKDSEIPSIIGDGERLGIHITYVTQPEAIGGGDALLRVEEYVHDSFFLINASHVDFSEFSNDMFAKHLETKAMVLLGKKETGLEKFGVMQVSDDKVVDIIEKPQEGQVSSDIKVIGIYLLTKDFFETLRSTAEGHYSLESAFSKQAQSHEMRYIVTEKESVSLKYAWDLLFMTKYLLTHTASNGISPNAEVSDHAIIVGDVQIEAGAKVMEGACIKGPVYIGANTVIGNNVLIREYTSIEKDCVIGAMTEIKQSLFMAGTKIHSGFVGDSIIGRDCRIAAYFCTGNLRLDREDISITIGDKKVTTHRRSFGILMGDNVHTGIRVSTMPGMIIGNHRVVGPSTTLYENVDDDTTVYTTIETTRKKRE